MKEKSSNKAGRASLDAYPEETHPQTAEPSGQSAHAESAPTTKRISAKMRRAVYLSRDTQERADFVVRRLGDRGANLLNFVERIVRIHLEDYTDENEKWRKL